MSQKTQNLILIRLQIRKKYQCPLRRTAVRFSDTLLESFFSPRAAGQMINFLHLDSRITKASRH